MSCGKFVCPYTDKCENALGLDCSTQVSANEKLNKNASREGRVDIVICQANHRFIPDVKEVK